MLLERARHAYADWKKRPAGFSPAREGRRRARQTRQVELPGNRLRLLTYNIQAGIGSQGFGDYVAGSWKQLVGHTASRDNIEGIADLLGNYDLVGLQEVDGGSLRSRNLNQLLHLAARGDFRFWHQQLNRNLGRFGQFSNGVLARILPFHVEDHRLPGLPGRGAILAQFGHPDEPLIIVIVHLALGEKYRNTQLAYLRDLLRDRRHVVVMGDFNCFGEHLLDSPLMELDLQLMDHVHYTYPSWAPDRHLDHILVTPSLRVESTQTLTDCRLSDHLPMAMELTLPESMVTAAREAC